MIFNLMQSEIIMLSSKNIDGFKDIKKNTALVLWDKVYLRNKYKYSSYLIQ